MEEELIKREWKRCKVCEYRDTKEVALYSFKSYCMFWDNWLKEIKWCNK